MRKMSKLLLVLIMLGFMFVGANAYIIERTFAQITTPGVTSPINTYDVLDHTFQIKTSSVSTNVIVRAEGSLDGTNYFNMNDDATDTTYTADGTYLLHKFDFKTKFVRLRMVSESGGTSVNVDVKYIGGN